jgi:hypothetical protein
MHAIKYEYIKSRWNVIIETKWLLANYGPFEVPLRVNLETALPFNISS